MKVIINRCFGGFGLSHEAILRYAEIKGITIFPVKTDSNFIKYHYYTDEAHENFFCDNEIPRDDPALVQVVEELGEIAYGQYAELTVVEIPDDVNWYIAEYDGHEHVAERHRTWR